LSIEFPGNLWLQLNRLRITCFRIMIFSFVPDNTLSQKASQFLAQHIHSVEQLEIFLTLAENPGRSWSVRQMFQKIQSSEKSIADCLDGFLAAGMARKDEGGAYRMSDQMSGLDELATE